MLAGLDPQWISGLGLRQEVWNNLVCKDVAHEIEEN